MGELESVREQETARRREEMRRRFISPLGVRIDWRGEPGVSELRTRTELSRGTTLHILTTQSQSRWANTMSTYLFII